MSASDLMQECLDHFNEPIILGFDIVRLIGFGQDTDDCYLIAQGKGGKIHRHTLVGGYQWLRALIGQDRVVSNGGEIWDDWTRINSLLELNGAPIVPEFIIEKSRDGCPP